ncbi:MAG: TraR/DksA family transcriptional regulator [Jatrophihabitans sp.]
MSTYAPTRNEPLTSNEQAALRGKLEQQRAFRIEQLTQLSSPTRLSLLNRPLSSTDHEVFTSLAAGARAALRDVQEALWRIDEGRYGRCTSCAEPLGIERLEILPQSALCMQCQQTATLRKPSG